MSVGDAEPTFLAGAGEQGQRLDAALAKWLPDFSRTALKRAITAGDVRVNDQACKPSQKLELGDRIVVRQVQQATDGPQPEAIDLDLLHEDDHLVAVNKPPRMVVHPSKGHWQGTLAAALAHHFGDSLSSIGGPTRPGIVHRLDRDTSGVIVVAKHDRAHERLAEQFANRTTEKEYLAIVLGEPDRDADVIDEPIGPHPHVREKMAIRRNHPDAREAVTVYEVVERFRRCSLVKAKPKTGRTHQIRVHLAHIGCPVLCDKQYGGRSRITATELDGGVAKPDEPSLLDRQALHASRLGIDHPETGERLAFEAPLAGDIADTLNTLRQRAP